MLNFLRIWLFLVYIVPFAYAVEKEFVINFMGVVITILAFYLSSTWNVTQNKTPINYSGFFTSSPGQLFVSFSCYILFKYSYIITVFGHFMAGDFIEWSLANAIARYNGDGDDPSVFYQLGSISMFLYSMLLGCIGVIDRKILFWGYSGLAFIFIIESSTLGRSGTLFCLLGLFTEFLIRKNSYFQKLRLRKFVHLFVRLFSILACVFLYSALNRLDSTDDIGETLSVKVGEYVVAPFQAFYKWQSSSGEQNFTYYPFFNSFTAIYKLFGFSVVQGAYPMVQTSYGETNIYTVFRAFYSDIGWFLTTICFILFGGAVKYFTYIKMNWISYLLIRSIFFFLLFAIMSPFYSSTFFVAAILAPLILYFKKL